MNRICIFILALLVSFYSAEAKAPFKENKHTDFYGRRHYRIALNLTNPLSGLTKYGAGLEQRNGNVSYIYSYVKYTGAYPGYQMNVEIQKYLRTRSRDQYYIYFKGLLGDAGFDSRKLSVYGDQSNILIGNFDENLKFLSGNGYGGGGFGFGRRYNRNVLFLRWNFGVKASALIGDIPTEEKNMYRLMFATGPASILEFNVHVGLQL